MTRVQLWRLVEIDAERDDVPRSKIRIYKITQFKIRIRNERTRRIDMRGNFIRYSILITAVTLLSGRATQAGGPYQFYAVAPCRIVDTRLAPGPTGGPALVGNFTTPVRSFPIRATNCNIPTTAQAAALNITIVSPTAGVHHQLRYKGDVGQRDSGGSGYRFEFAGIGVPRNGHGNLRQPTY